MISKSKPLKKFRSSLQSFLTRLFVAAAASEILYDTSFCQVFQSWLTSLSSSKIRSFRHTATVFSLSAVSALCQVAVGVNKEFAGASRALEAEQKKGRKDKSRLKDLEKTVGEVHERKTKLEEYMTELFEAYVTSFWPSRAVLMLVRSVFVHRYRDSEQLIRGECIKALGEWMKIHPEYWLEGNYLRYIGWVLSDDVRPVPRFADFEADFAIQQHKDVRHESVKALLSLYTKEDNISSMLHFTERFKAQLVRMATSEIDLAVRISCILVLQSINRHNLLEDEQTDEIAKLIFEEEKRVRLAVAAFFGGILDEAVKERETVLEAGRGGSPEIGARDAEAMDRLRLKCLAELLVKYGKETDGGTESDADEEADVEREGLTKKLSTNSLDVVRTHRGRIALAVEALWDSVKTIRNWQAMIDLLVLDQSVEGGEDQEATPKSKSKKKGKKVKKSTVGDDPEFEETCRLTEEEETLLVEVLVASLGRATGSTATSKKVRSSPSHTNRDADQCAGQGQGRGNTL